jgi:hypothetical protein
MAGGPRRSVEAVPGPMARRPSMRQLELGQLEPGQVELDQLELDQVEPGQVELGQVERRPQRTCRCLVAPHHRPWTVRLAAALTRRHG